MIATVAALSAGTAFMLGGYLTARVTVGQCQPPTSLVENFSSDDYLGVWYELKRDKDISFYEDNYECTTAAYEAKDNGEIKVTNNSFLGYYDGSDGVDNIVGKAEINKWYPGRLGVSFFADILGDYQIVDTDYTSYTIVYGCSSFLDIRLAEFYWVLSRDPLEEGSSDWTSLFNIVNPILDAKLPYYDYDYDMKVTKQGTGCTYFN